MQTKKNNNIYVKHRRKQATSTTKRQTKTENYNKEINSFQQTVRPTRALLKCKKKKIDFRNCSINNAERQIYLITGTRESKRLDEEGKEEEEQEDGQRRGRLKADGGRRKGTRN